MESRHDTNVITLDRVGFRFAAESVLQDVDLGIPAGGFTVIVGPNGGGKTTLLHLILGLYRPETGRVRVFGDRPGSHPARIGYVPQHGNLAPGFPATVEQVVLMGLAHGHRHGPRFHADERELAHGALERTGIADLARRPFSDLSGGQRQRVLIARALITHPELLLLDEPFSNIDPYGRACIHETLEDLGDGITRVMVSHDLGITRQAVSQVIAVNRWAVSGDGPVITEEMLALMYGHHGEDCPMSQPLADAAFMPAVGGHRR
ncbi:MAG: metal ABC transporter ATP-binding protein [Halothiobacillaceae bacterium]|nr:metal ABC transporter ATP-binding protein [Halothiobacillaceae bacterium]HER35041.1 metal ABC transporter ATP-binding protein [Halothiobacillaceae bacterium]